MSYRYSQFDFDGQDIEQEIQLREESAPTLRPYQVEAVDAVFREWDEGQTATLVCLPTGTGKTVCFSEVMTKWMERCEES